MAKDNTVIVLAEPPRPLSIVKQTDLIRIANRLMAETGYVSFVSLYLAARSRIPGTIDQYKQSFHRLVRSGAIVPRRRQETN